MSDKNTPGMGFEVNIRSATSRQTGQITDVDTPFCMAVLGDFSGRFDQPMADDKPLVQRKLISVDRDNFDEVLASFQLNFDICLSENPETPIHIEVNELDDFHPDALYQKLEIFSRLRDIRRRLQNKQSFDAAASEIMGWLVPQAAPQADTEQATQSTAPAPDVSGTELLDNILGSAQPSATDQSAGQSVIEQLVKQVIAPYVEPSTNPRQPEMLDAVDEATAAHMRAILHHPRFQQLEAAWRSIYFLISRIATDSRLKIYLLDVSKPELQADLSGEVDVSAMHKRFCEPVMNDIPWSLLLGNYRFDDTIDDALLLAQLGSIAQQAQAPFIAAAHETLAGCEGFGQYPDADDWHYQMKPGAANAWTLLRQEPGAAYLGLALPRFLLRAPYGNKSAPIETFKFEEMPELCHECFLWGNAAFIKAEQLARAFSNRHWNMQPGEAHQTENLPMYYFEQDGETALFPCAEIYLTEKGGQRLSGQGLIPLWSVKNADTIRSSDFNALAADGSSLQGRWVR